MPAGSVPWHITPGVKPRAFLLGSGDRPNLLAEADRLRPVIDEHLNVVLADFQYAQDLAQRSADLAVVLGGDGSILQIGRAHV